MSIRERVGLCVLACLLGCTELKDGDDRSTRDAGVPPRDARDGGDQPSTPDTGPDADVPPDGGGRRPRCGDGELGGAELCDVAIAESRSGACPEQCPALATCGERSLRGTGCQAECVELESPGAHDAGCCPTASSASQCRDGDGCCLGACDAGVDDDCSTRCGNGVIDSEMGETCEPGSAMPCPESCDDGDPCTSDELTGSAGNCNVRCTRTQTGTPGDADGCCPTGSTAISDPDCSPCASDEDAGTPDGCHEGTVCCEGACVNVRSSCYPWPCIPGTNGDEQHCGGCGESCLSWCCLTL